MSSLSSLSRLAVIIGAGPGLGFSLVRRFAREGFSVAAIARNDQSIKELIEKEKNLTDKIFSFPADCGDENSLRSAFTSIRDQLGNPEVLLYNASNFEISSILELKPNKLESSIKVSTIGLLIASQEILPAQIAAGRGFIGITGATASLRGGAKFAGLAVPKFATRALAQSLAREFQPKGIHVAHVIVDGQISSSRRPETLTGPAEQTEKFINPDAIADSFWFLFNQEKSAWTQELDLRPHVEKF